LERRGPDHDDYSECPTVVPAPSSGENDAERTALVRALKEVFRRHRSQPIERVIVLINPVLWGWVNYFAVRGQLEPLWGSLPGPDAVPDTVPLPRPLTVSLVPLPLSANPPLTASSSLELRGGSRWNFPWWFSPLSVCQESTGTWGPGPLVQVCSGSAGYLQTTGGAMPPEAASSSAMVSSQVTLHCRS
jgi:hypothetical protein